MSSHNSSYSHDNRPAYMITLGLAPPYAAEDVKQAYLEKAKLALPDRGGSTAAFNEIQQATAPQEYLAFPRRPPRSGSPRRWTTISPPRKRSRAQGPRRQRVYESR